jgi:hypothetical protein
MTAVVHGINVVVACHCLSGPGPSNFIRPLMLDLNTLPREDGPPSESVLKRQKFAVFEKHCSQVGAARQLPLLRMLDSMSSTALSTLTPVSSSGGTVTAARAKAVLACQNPTVHAQKRFCCICRGSVTSYCTATDTYCRTAGGRWAVCLWRGCCA